MTSNQIAAAATRESVRHNQAYEEETAAHNRRMEELDQERNNITADYNKRSLDLQEWYNTEYINYLNASEEDKVELENRLNDIKQQQADAEQAYKEAMTGLEGRKQSWNESYQAGLLELEGENLNIQNKRAYYEQQKTEAYVADLLFQQQMSQKKYNLETERIEKEYSLGLIDANTRQQQLKNAQIALEFEMTKYAQVGHDKTMAEIDELKARAMKERITSATEAVNSVSRAVDSALPF